MKSSWDTPARAYAKGIGEAVADRTVNRLIDGRRETWADVALRVAIGNTSLRSEDAPFEFDKLHHHLRQASILLSGRHLQHGDETQPSRNQEVFTNCSTSAMSAIEFYLLLNGSGVGRCYDDDMMLVDWARDMPTVVPFIRRDHPDVVSGEIDLGFTAMATRTFGFGAFIVYKVPDSREGWAKAVEQIERLTFEGIHRDSALVLDFSDVRQRGAPIGGMQNRPASGPGPLMQAIEHIAHIKDNGMEPWEATMHVDHFLAECVLVGGARRAARMATKTWRDKSAMQFVHIKRGGKLWSSNNSITVDEEFWTLVRAFIEGKVAFDKPLQVHAAKLFNAICEAAYHDGTGEPGLINVDRLTRNDEGIEALLDGNFAESARFKLDAETLGLTSALAKVFADKDQNMIVNPCGEIPLALLGGYCVIADVVPYHAGSTLDEPSNCAELDKRDRAWDDEVEDAFRTATRALLRVNLMDCLYSKEVKRTNRIGVGFTGIHEYAYARFGYGWKQLVNEQASLPFWKTMARYSQAIVDEARRYSEVLGQTMPHTVTTVKPAGTTSKLFGLTEGAHLPSMREYLRWVQFRNDDPLIEQYRARGYPVRVLKTYSGTTIVGFPTVPEICQLGMGDLLVTAAEATPEEQYQWLRLLEKYWLHGTEHIRGLGLWSHEFGGQVSYTLKLDPAVVGFEEFRRTLLQGQSTIKACSVMPQADTTAYEYQPEQPLTPDDFREIASKIMDDALREEIGLEHVDCATGACPIDFRATNQG
jgi:adenosylcobalamin-dependent ribonucleoside-triphosphate reductase